MTAPAPQRPRLVYLDEARAVCALLVVLQHVWLTNYALSSARPTAGARALTHWMVYGNYAVTSFIVISGWSLMIGPASRDAASISVRSFARSRLLRILPPYYAALLLSTVASATWLSRSQGTVWDLSLPSPGLGDLLKQLLLLQDVVPVHLSNYVFWSIAVEVHVYLLFPIGYRLVRSGFGWKLAAGLLLLAYTGLAATRLAGGVVRLHPQFAGFFVLGMAGYWLASRRPARPGRWLVGAVALFALLVAVNWRLGEDDTIRFYSFTQLLVAVFTVLLLQMSQARPARLMRRRFGLAAAGLISYSLYLTHAVVVATLWRFAAKPLGLQGTLGLMVSVTVGVPLCLAAAYLFYRLVERPFFMARGRSAPADDVRATSRN